MTKTSLPVPERSEPVMQSRVGLVVLTFNCREAARRCLESIRTLTYSPIDVIVVDNASSDETAAMVRKSFPTFDLVETGANLGYTGGNNRGIERALMRGAEYVAVMNPDAVVVNRSFIESLVDFMEKNPNVGIAGPRVFLRTTARVQNTVLVPPGMYRNLTHWFLFRVNQEFAHRSGDSVVEAEVLNGVCLMMRADALRQVGLFDEQIFMYIEDADLDYRMHRAGWRVVYVPVDSIVHEQKHDGYDMFSNVSFLLRRNSVYYLQKNGRPVQAWSYAVLSLLLMVVRSLSRRRTASLRASLRFPRLLMTAYWRLLIKRDTELPALPSE